MPAKTRDALGLALEAPKDFVKADRQRAIETFVRLEAIEGLIAYLGAGRHDALPVVSDELGKEIFGDELSCEDVSTTLTSPLFNALWPDDENTQSDEYTLTISRGMLLTARILNEFALHPYRCGSMAESCFAWAQAQLGALKAPVPTTLKGW